MTKPTAPAKAPTPAKAPAKAPPTPQPVDGAPVAEATELVALPGAASVAEQADRLGNARLQAVQRQLLADKVGQEHGNGHMQQVMALVKQGQSFAPYQSHIVHRYPSIPAIQRKCSVCGASNCSCGGAAQEDKSVQTKALSTADTDQPLLSRHSVSDSVVLLSPALRNHLVPQEQVKSDGTLIQQVNGAGENEFLVQPKLDVNAVRQIEPLPVGQGGNEVSEAGAEQAPTMEAETAAQGTPPIMGGSATAEGGGDRATQSSMSGNSSTATQRTGSGPSPSTPSGGGGTVTTGTSAACSGGGEAQCYDAPSEQPAEEPAEIPPNPEPTRAEAQTSDSGEEELAETDDCPPEVAAVAPGGSNAPVTSTASQSGNAAAATAPTATATDDGIASLAGGGAISGGGMPDNGSQSAGSPLDSAIAQTEAQRDAAIVGYSASSAALIAASDGTQSLRNGALFARDSHESSEVAARRSGAIGRADQFFAGVADQLEQAIAFVSQQVPDQLGAQAESIKAQLAASIETQKAAISGRIERARGQARTDAALARQAVREQTAAFIATAQAETAAAITDLTATHGATMEQVGTLETATLDHVNQIYADGRAMLEGLGTTIGNECTAIGERYAATYRGFRHCTENGFWDGDLSERRSEAQENAAREVAKGYHDRMVEAAQKRAREITRDGRKKDRCAIIASASHARNTLDEQLANVIASLGVARDASITQAGTARDGILASIDSSLAATLRQLDQQEHEQRQAADDTGYMQQVLQEQIAHAAATSLQRGVVDAATAAQSALAPLKTRFANSVPPDPDVLDQALSLVTQRLNATLGELQTTIEGGVALSVEQLASAGQQGLSALNSITQSNDEGTATISDGFTASMSVIAGTDNFADQRTGFTQQVQQSSAAGSAALGQALDGMRQACDKTTGASETTLTQAANDLEQNLQQSKQGIECAITQKADEAASHEAPAWKRALAVVLVILVVVIVIAVIVATAGMALGPLATIAVGIAIGAAVGAVTSGLLAIASNLWNNRSWSQGVGKAIAVGAITGAIGGGIGAAAGLGVGLALKGASAAVQLAAQFGAAMVTAGGLDVVTQYVMDGFSFEHFSWANLGMTLVITAVTFGIGHAAATRAAAAKAQNTTTSPGETSTPTSTPGETTTPTGTSGETTTPTGTSGETTTPTSTPGETTTPTSTPEETTTPTSTPGETTTPTGTSGETTTPTSTPGETTTPTSTLEETTTPASTPEETIPTSTPEETTTPASTPEETIPTSTPEETTTPTSTPEETTTPTSTPEETSVPSREERLNELARDPDHGNAVSDASRAEAEAALGLEESGELPGPVRRPERGDGHSGDFVDGQGGDWDVKAPRSRQNLIDEIKARARAAGRRKPQIDPARPIRGEFDVAHTMTEIRGELAAGENVIIDTRSMNPTDLASLRAAIGQEGLGNRVKFYP